MIKFKKTYGGRYPNPVFYSTGKIQFGLDYQGQYVMADVENRVNGPRTSMARVYISIEWPSSDDNKFYGYLYRHFNGKNSLREAVRWARFLCENPPIMSDIINGKLRDHGK
jgi:hypothetical protein